MLKFCSILNGCSLEPEPTFFVWSIFAPPHTSRANYSAIHIWLKKYIILWLLHKKPNWYIAYLTSWTKELTLQDQFTCRGQSFWMETSCHVVCSRKSKQLIHYDSIGFRNKTQTAERACPDFQTYRLSLHWSMFILTFSLCLQSIIRLNSQFPHIRWFKLDPTAHTLLSITYKQLLPKRAGITFLCQHWHQCSNGHQTLGSFVSGTCLCKNTQHSLDPQIPKLWAWLFEWHLHVHTLHRVSSLYHSVVCLLFFFFFINHLQL